MIVKEDLHIDYEQNYVVDLIKLSEKSKYQIYVYWRDFLGPSFGHIFILSYTNNLSINIVSTATLFTNDTPDDTSSFSMICRKYLNRHINRKSHLIKI